MLRKIHAWAGLALCLLLVPLALSGASLVFKPQWIRATVPGAAEAVTVTPAGAAAAVAAAKAEFADVRSVVFASPEVGLHQVNTADGGGYIAPDGAVVQRWGKNERVVDWLFDLHHHLLAGETGVKVAGIAGLFALTMILTGLVLWLPSWRSFAWTLSPRRGGRAGWLAAHRDLGVIAAPIAVVITLTGSAVALNQWTPKVMGFTPAKPPAAGAGETDWAGALAAAQAQFPEATLRMAVMPAKAGRAAVVRLRQPGEWHTNGRTVVHVDPKTGRILQAEDAMAHPLQQRAYNAFWPIHASKVGGLAWKLLTFLTGLSLAALAVYGAESYRRKLFPPRRARPAPMKAPAAAE
ncbi:PepSY-associated TM helix domain-containing protein [Phenylobacterium sp.]|uniref:PepSY-associated TM helix domain-containing protein n=1 Tax=Phenylobacterium sp. TaxID=1871053 RepID=UPI002F947712